MNRASLMGSALYTLARLLVGRPTYRPAPPTPPAPPATQAGPAPSPIDGPPPVVQVPPGHTATDNIIYFT